MNSRYNQERKYLLSQERSVNDIQIFLKQQNDLDLTIIKDQKKNSVLHFCSFQNKQELIKIYIQFMEDFYSKKGDNVKTKITEWVNTKNQQGFAAMHYSAYKGYISILEFLIQKGATIDMKTTNGMNNLHLAAQGNRVITFIYFRNKLNINERDTKNSSALHWASYMGSENAVEYLLAQPERELDLQDSEGQTALHLATAYGNTRIVRRLLIAGAKRNIKNSRDELPIKIAQDNQFTNIQKMLDDKYSCLDYLRFYCNIKIKYKPQSKSMFQPIIFYICTILFTAGTGILIKFEQPLIDYIILGFIVLFLLLYTSLLISPPKNQKRSYQYYLKQQDKLEKSCMQCITNKPPRSTHCDICNVCVQQYDHHCPWINNCVGKFNIGRFVCFLFFILLVMLLFILLNICALIMKIDENLLDFNFIEKRNILPKDQNYQIAYYIIPGIIILVCFSFFIPLLFLLSVQIKNLLLNRTTFERFSKNNRSVVNQSSRSFSSHIGVPQPTMSLSNCLKMCYGRQSGLDQQLVTEYSMISTQNNR